MLILNQSEEEIHNVDHISEIFIDSVEHNYGIWINNHHRLLGEYISQQRAKEVLHEIFVAYKTSVFHNVDGVTLVPCVFAMPQH